jgi:hypothetical protein
MIVNQILNCKIKDRCRSGYIVLKHDSWTQLCLITLLIWIKFFNKMILKKDTHMKVNK